MKQRIHKLLAVVTFLGATSAGAIAAPRTLANGAPAPGNTVAKGYKKDPSTVRMERARRGLVAALSEEKEAKRELASQPRTLPTGSPACGNTESKAPPPRSAEQIYQAQIERARTAERAVQRARQRLHEVTRKVALLKQGGSYSSFDDDDDDYS